MNKPIEVGCVVVIVDGLSWNCGRYGTVKRYDPFPPDGVCNWEVAARDGETFTGRSVRGDELTRPTIWCTTDQLRRIDDYKEETVEEEQEVVV